MKWIDQTSYIIISHGIDSQNHAVKDLLQSYSQNAQLQDDDDLYIHFPNERVVTSIGSFERIVTVPCFNPVKMT